MRYVGPARSSEATRQPPGGVAPSAPAVVGDLRALQPERIANGRRPVEEELANVTPAKELAKLLRAMRQLCVAGLPPDPQRFTATWEKVGKSGAGHLVAYLKPNKCAYRAYVARWSHEELIFLYVMGKPGWKRGSGNDEYALNRLDEVERGLCRPVPLNIPDPR